jgi:prepilin-type N-terminal cleavage/methylation domain-containing protein
MVTRLKPWRKSAGVTLVELMITVAIIGGISLVVPELIVNTTRFFNVNRARYEIQRDSKTILALINRNLRQGMASTVVITQDPGQPPYSKITFDKYVNSTTTRAISYYQSGAKLYTVDNGKSRILSSNLRYLAFSYPRTDDAHVVSVSMTMEKATYEGKTKALQMAVEKVRIMND